MRVVILLVLCAVVSGGPVEGAAGQRSRTPAAPKSKPAPPPPPAPKTEPAEIKCSELLGTGVKTSASFCFVLAGREPAQGVVVTIPPHVGTATLTFSLHNRHTYSEEEMRAGRGFAKYTAVVAVLTMAGDVLGRGAVQSEFRSAKDLYAELIATAPPSEQRSFTHGDYCLPNVLLVETGTGGFRVSGFVDCANAGIADPYQDLALCARSVAHNLGAEWVPALFGRYGLERTDEQKLAYYQLLDEFF